MNVFFKKNTLKYVITLMTFLLTISAAAAKSAINSNRTNTSQWKQVEIIIFSKFNTKALLSEQWQTPSSIPDIRNITVLNSYQGIADNAPSPQALPPHFFQLQKVVNRLQSNGYMIILHTAWLENFAQQLTNPIQLVGGQVWRKSFLGSINELNGTIDIRSNRFFTVKVDLLLIEPLSQFTSFITKENIEKNFYNISNNMAYFTIDQQRRVNADELNYFDHPLFGMLLKVTYFKDNIN